MAELKRLGVMSAAKVSAVISAIYGLVMGAFMAFSMSAINAAGLGALAGAGGAGLFLQLGILSVIAMPIFFAISGFIGGAIGAFLYNVVAGKVGGIKMEFEGK